MGCMPRQRLELALSGPSFYRSVRLAREAVTAIVHGGEAAVGSLEFVLTEVANDQQARLALTLVLAQLSANLAIAAADSEEPELNEDDMLTRAQALVEETVEAIREAGGKPTDS